MTQKAIERQQAIESLRELLKPGDTVYTTVKSVSRSGMSRSIDVHLIRDNEPRWIARTVAKAIGWGWDDKREAVKASGCGMDMGFHLVYSLSCTLFPDGFTCPGAKCGGNDHVNYRRFVQCHGTPGDDGVPCFPDDQNVYRLRTGTGENFSLGEVCPVCKGKGGWDNPEPRPDKGFHHRDGGYALHQRWM